MENQLLIKKVYMLEDLVLNGSVDELKAFIAENAPFEYTARALGYACVYGGIEKVKCLLECGASFKKKPLSLSLSEFVMSNHADFQLMPVDTDYFNVIRNNGGFVDFHFDYSKERYADWENWITLSRTTGQDRKEIIECLLGEKKIGFAADKAMFYAIIWKCEPALEVFAEHGIHCGDLLRDAAINPSKGIGKELMGMLKAASPEDAAFVLKWIKKELSDDQYAFFDFNVMFNATGNTCAFLSDEVLSIVLDSFSEKLKLQKVVTSAIENDMPQALALLADKGVFSKKSSLLKYIDKAQSEQHVEVLAWLMQYNAEH